jgi:hypothetical protein
MKDLSSKDRLPELLTLDNLIFKLVEDIDRLLDKKERASSRPLTAQYNRYRKHAAKLAQDANLADLVPQRAWYIRSWMIVAYLGFVLTAGTIGIVSQFSHEDAQFLVIVLAVATLPVFVLYLMVVRNSQPWSHASYEEIRGLAIPLLDLVREIIKETDPESAANLRLDPIPRKPEELAPVAAHVTSSDTNDTRQAELEKRFVVLTKRIGEIDIDIGRETEEFRRRPLVERRDDLEAERTVVKNQLAEIDLKLAGIEPTPDR